MAKAVKNVVKKTVKHNGVNVVVPIFTPESVPTGIVRKTRHLAEAERNEEVMWLMFEYVLSDKELEVLDRLPAQDLETVLSEAYEDEDELPKS
jgi:hypothetical protein